MKNLTDFINENIFDISESEDEIKSEKDFRKYAKNKFEEVFGDDLDKDKMKDIIDGIINDNKKAIEDNDWGKLVGILNKSFGS